MLVQTKTKIFLSLAVVVFFFAGFLGGANFGMTMSENGEMSNCPFMDSSASVCRMNPLEHIATWQSMFTALSERNTFALSLILLLAFLATSFLRTPRHTGFASLAHVRRLRPRSRPPEFFSTLQEAFSSGILHPKIF